MTEQEFLEIIRQRQRIAKMSNGGMLPMRRFAGGGTTERASQLADEFGNEKLGDAYRRYQQGDTMGAVGSAVTGVADPLGIFTGGEGVQNTFQANSPAVASADWQAGMADARGQMSAAQQSARDVNAAQSGLIGQMGTQAGRLQDRAMGNGPSLADMQMRQGMQQNAASAASMAASMRGVNPALAARMAGQQASQANAQMAGQAMQGRLAEQQAAEAQLAGVRGQQAGVMGQQSQSALGQMGAWGNAYGANAQGAASKYGTDVQADIDIQKINAQTAEENAKRQADASDGWFAKGGPVRRRYEDGGDVPFYSPPPPAPLAEVPSQDRPFYEPPAFQTAPEPLEQKWSGLMSDIAAMPPPGDSSAADSAKNEVVADPAIKAAVGDKPAEKKNGIMSATVLPLVIKMAMDALRRKNRGSGFVPRAHAEGGEIGAPEADVSGGVPKYFWGAIASTLGSQLLSKAMSGDEQGNARVYGGYGVGGPVPGQARVQGDDERNDTVPALLSAGEIVLPRSVAMAEDAPARAAGFVKGIQAAKEQDRQDLAIALARRAHGGVIDKPVGKPNFERLMKRQAALAKKIAELGSELDKSKG